MNISAAFIRKPIATSLLMAAILLLGLISYELLPVAALPNVDTPTVMVTAQLPGADAQTVASTVTTPLERQFGQIPGLTQMTSSSGNESSTITLQFDRSVSVDFASQAVQAAINAAAGFLPSMPTPPIYRLTNPADTPVQQERPFKLEIAAASLKASGKAINGTVPEPKQLSSFGASSNRYVDVRPLS
jgi:HAE1 family hydrophobic/amphiphilic exporter-1